MIFPSEIPDVAINLAIVVFGLLIGSFLNVVIHRLPEKKSIVHPPSSCPKCGHQIRWYENIPVLSYLALGGKCRKCKTPISVRYPLVELLTALLFLAVKLRYGAHWLLLVRDFPFIAALIAITFIDLQHRIIPDVLSLGGLALGLATAYWDPNIGLTGALIGAVVGFALFYLTAWFYAWRTGRSGLGGGDIKLLAMLGAFVGVQGVITTILVSSVLGTVFGIAVFFAQKRQPHAKEAHATHSMKTAEAKVAEAAATPDDTLMKFSIPYGPFLVLGALYSYLLSEVLWSPFTSPM